VAAADADAAGDTAAIADAFDLRAENGAGVKSRPRTFDPAPVCTGEDDLITGAVAVGFLGGCVPASMAAKRAGGAGSGRRRSLSAANLRYGLPPHQIAFP